MERRTRWAAMAITAYLASSSAYAEQDGFYAGVSLGRFKQSAETEDWLAYDPGNGTLVPGVRVDSDNGAPGGALSLGYRINQHFAAELSFLNSGSVKRANSFENLGTATRTTRISGPTLSILPSIDLGSKLSGYVRAGVLFAHEKVGYEGGFSQTFGDTTWIAGVGLDYSLSEHWKMSVEYMRSGNLDEPVESGGNHLSGATLGMKYRF